MSDFQFTTGVFRDFKATTRFHLGKIQTDVYKDSIVQFDGSTLKLDGASYSLPEIRSAIKAGWLTPVESSISDYAPQSANVKVRSAQDKGKAASTEVQRDETYIAPARKAETKDGVRVESKAFNATLIRDTEGDGRTVGPSTRRTDTAAPGASSEGETVAKLKTAAKRSFSVDGSTSMNVDVENGDVTDVVEYVKGTQPKVRQESESEVISREGQSSDGGRVIASVKTAAKRKVTLTDANAVDAEINKLDNSTRTALAPKGKRDIAALAGDTLEEVVPANEPENRGRMLAEQAKAKRLFALRAKEAEEKPPVFEYDADVPEEGDLSDEGKSLPVKVLDAVPPKVTAKPPKSVEDFAVNGDELEIAPGVRWNKKLHWKSRVKQALQYRDRPELLNLIRGYEVPSVVKQIDAALASGSSE